MDAQRTFTGRTRRRQSHPWVRFGDALARGLITAGGIGTIVAVLLVGVFLLVVAAPLFSPARARPAGGMSAEAAEPLAVGSDESGDVAWLLDVNGIRAIGVADGQTLLERAAIEGGLENCSAVRVLPGSLLAAVGFADGSFRTGRLGLESAYLSAADLPADLEPPGEGEAVRAGDAIVVRGQGGQFSRVSLVTDLATAGGEALPARVIDLDVTPLPGGPLVAALDDAGTVRVESSTSRRNMLTGKRTTTSDGATIAPADGFRPRFVRVSELGDQLFLLAADGAGRRYAIRNVREPVLMESFETGAPVTAVSRLFGGTALSVAGADGGVRIMFPARPAAGARDEAKLPEDGLRMVTAREFPPRPGAAAITAAVASPRSRLFAVADAEGRVRLLHSTSGRELAGMPAPADQAGSGRSPVAAVALAIPPKENRLVAAGGRGLAAWAIDAGYPEVSFRTLLQPVWYESYPGPVHAWETTGHESFESKFGLVPLIFGTIKATLYAMLFATPIAILAAIYTSQFMHPRWKARVKPTIEMMASLPSVVLGFIAGLVFAPVLEQVLMPVLTGFFVVPLAILAAAHLWQLLPAGLRTSLAGWRFALVACAAIPAGVAAAVAVAPAVERLLFRGDIRSWLDGRDGSGFGGWVLATLPLGGLAAVWIVGRLVNPWLRRAGAGWKPRQAGLAALGVFVGGVAVAVLLAVAAAAFFDAIRLDTRGGLFGTYVQRNAMVVAVGMSFAIIPLVFTIADDALASVPEHLRSASLGAGATPWQTAVRVIVPAAASGLFSAVMIGLGRAVGETMIVLMAAGNTPLVSWNLFNGFQTLSAAIATELPEAARNSTHYRVLFLAALALFAMTFVVNTAAEIVRQRFRRRAHEL
ncbi:MAG: ABC transporter permease subunit [Planctomycetota bacterium]